MFAIIALQCALFNLVLSYSNHPILIVVSYDGFRYDYFQKGLTSYMSKLRSEGTYADYLTNVFPTKTFPNHFTIASGLYTEVHGVVGNSFYDPQLDKIVYIEADMFLQNNRVIPIWTLNEIAGNDRHSGVMMWPGGEFPYQNRLPTYYNKWDPKYDFRKRIDTAISWIKDPDKPANLVMLYFEDPDTHSHIYGPDSDTVYNIIKQLDNISQYLDDKLRENNLANKVNVVHLSDHGMISVNVSNILDVTKYLKLGTYVIADSSPCMHVIPNKGYEIDVYDRLQQASIENGHFNVYKRRELLDRWHFKNNPRIPPIFLLAHKGYGFQDLLENIKKYQKAYNIKVTPDMKVGVHGYDNEMEEMHPFFMAHGPVIKKNHKIKPFSTLDLYGLFAAILEIKAQPYNGTFSNVQDILRSQSNASVLTSLLIAVGGILLSLLLVSGAAAVTILLIKRQQNITTAAALNKRFPQSFHHSIEAQHLLDTEEA